MADTRTIYLISDDNTVFTSDPSETEFNTISITDISDLNTNDITTLSSGIKIYDDYDISLTLTFNNRESRAQWVADYQDHITQISVANSKNKNVVFNKKAKIKTFDFTENPYINGVQLILTLTISGKWRSSISVVKALASDFSGGNKRYIYQYDYQYGYQRITNNFNWQTFNTVIIEVEPQYNPVFLHISDGNNEVVLSGNRLNSSLQIASDFNNYTLTYVNQFSILTNSFIKVDDWSNLLTVYGDLKNLFSSHELQIFAIDNLGTPVSINVYSFNQYDLI